MEKEIKVGKKIIDILMFSMYPDAKIIYREYIQNARDAIKDAVEAGVLSSFQDGHISINIDNNTNTIEIKDNGIGVKEDDIFEKLLNIADSTKDGENSAGQFGIGRLVGGGYCRKMSFKTSFKGEKTASIVEYDIEKARKIIDDDNNKSSATQLIEQIIDISSEAEQDNEHYFIAKLEGVKNDYPDLLNETLITDYLQQVAPIDYKLVFKNQLVNISNNKFKNIHNSIDHFRISVNDNLDIRKTYTTKIEGTQDDIDSLQYFEIKDDKFGSLAWGWYAITKFSKKIPASDKSRCIRLRKHNIMLGNEIFFDEYFKEERGNYYFYGEVHITNSKLKPDSSRSGLAPTPEAERFKILMREKFDELHNLYYLANQIKTATRDIVVAKTEEQQSPEKLPTATKKLESAITSSKAQSAEGKKVIELYTKKLAEIIKSPTNTTISQPQNEGGTTSITTPRFSNKTINKFDPLKLFYSEQEVAIVKLAFEYLLKHCPSQYSKLIEELINKVIKDLSK
jgi:molecular chaperone HtpG